MHWSSNKFQPCISPRWAPFAPRLPSGCLCTSGSRASRVSSRGREDRGDGLKCKPVQSPTSSWLGLSQAMVETHRGLSIAPYALWCPHVAHCVFSLREVKWSEMKSLSRVRLFATPWTVAYQAPLSMGFSRQECWSGLPFPFPGDFPSLRCLFKWFQYWGCWELLEDSKLTLKGKSTFH